jgi:hypothetical protein
MKVGNWVYVPFSMDGEAGNYVYLGQVIHTEENGVRVHFTDASVENDVEGGEEFWTDFPPSHCGYVVDKDGDTNERRKRERGRETTAIIFEAG